MKFQDCGNQKKISAIAQWKEFTIEYVQILMGDKKNLLVSLMFPVIAAIIVIWIAGENMFVHYDGTKGKEIRWRIEKGIETTYVASKVVQKIINTPQIQKAIQKSIDVVMSLAGIK
jgi:hypothetical protein